jgi:hypothetical protein
VVEHVCVSRLCSRSNLIEMVILFPHSVCHLPEKSIRMDTEYLGAYCAPVMVHFVHLALYGVLPACPHQTLKLASSAHHSQVQQYRHLFHGVSYANTSVVL